MAKKVRIPTPLRKLTNNEEVVEVDGATIGDAITELQSRYPGIKERLVDEKGEVPLEADAASSKGEGPSGPPTKAELARARQKEPLHA